MNEKRQDKEKEQRDKLIQKMVTLLREGHRMLDETCPQCGTILFLRKDVGLRYCPNCEIFFATPKELSKIDTSRIRILGEVKGGEIIRFEQHPPISENMQANKMEKVTFNKRIGKEDNSLKIQLEFLIKKILDQISYMFEFESKRLSIKELLELLKIVLEIQKIL